MLLICTCFPFVWAVSIMWGRWSSFADDQVSCDETTPCFVISQNGIGRRLLWKTHYWDNLIEEKVLSLTGGTNLRLCHAMADILPTFRVENYSEQVWCLLIMPGHLELNRWALSLQRKGIPG